MNKNNFESTKINSLQNKNKKVEKRLDKSYVLFFSPLICLGIGNKILRSFKVWSIEVKYWFKELYNESSFHINIKGRCILSVTVCLIVKMFKVNV